MKFTSLLITVLAVTLGATGCSALAEKRDLTFVKTSTQTMSKSGIAISESPNHEVTQEVMHQRIKYSSPDFQVEEEWVYVQADSVDGSGLHQGFFTFVHAGGERTYGSFEGNHKTVVKEDGVWLTTWEGKVRHLGGTGPTKGESEPTNRSTKRGATTSSIEPMHIKGEGNIGLRTAQA